jgi:phenylacetic acid degradation operon negative regulatory protein
MVAFNPEVASELAAKRVEFDELNLPRLQTGFPPQHLLLTLFGDFWANRSEAIPSASLVDLLADFDVSEAGARAAIARLAKRGNLEVVRNGRVTSYAVAPVLAALLPFGPLHTRAFGPSKTGWDGTWTTVSFSVADNAPADTRSRVRSGLEVLRFAPLHDGLWVSPFPPSDALVAVLTADPAVSSTVVRGRAEESFVSPVTAWDLTEPRRIYDEFLATFRPIHQRLAQRPLSDREALIARVRVAYRWFVIATTDPDLPAVLLPADWPRDEAHAIYSDLFQRLGPQSAKRFRKIIAARSPDLAALVTLP